MNEEFYRQQIHEMVDSITQLKRLTIVYFFIVGLVGSFNKNDISTKRLTEEKRTHKAATLISPVTNNTLY
ncbi:hypothetical protein CG709_15785, partial [Lachnotalea glycerini]